ncbi:class I SAM-dependent methyltransferase [Tundrisphaera lichenicola]|uniref:class I SAM-dependent methyltransferase n=1 Tax=Tundrisphaera lichenicola TaxID=2029860 RepID=UPI003EB76336
MAKEPRQVSLFPGFEISTDDTFLDVGCGGGGDCATAASVGADIIAVDIVPDHVAAAARAVEQVGAGSFRGIVSDCDPIPLPDATASIILCCEVMEHVKDPARFIAELVRVGKPGAHYVISVPAAASEGLMKVLAPPSYFEPPGHLRIFEQSQFEGLIQSTGLVIERSEGLGFYWSMWWALRMACGTNHCPDYTTPPPQILSGWEETWKALEATPLGPQVVRVLDNLIPKSIRVIARKPVPLAKPHFNFSGKTLAR